MQCPYLKKVNFQRVEQIGQMQEIQTAQISKVYSEVIAVDVSQLSLFSEQESVILQEQTQLGFNTTTKMNLHLYRQNEQQYQCAHIKFPKHMQIKKMIKQMHQKPLDCEIPSQTLIQQSPISPHVLISKSNIMSARQVQQCQGQVYLVQFNTQTNCHYEICSNVLKVTQNRRNIWCVDLWKMHCQFQKNTNNKVNLKFERNNTSHSVKLRFNSEKQQEKFITTLKATLQKIPESKLQYMQKYKFTTELDQRYIASQSITFQQIQQTCNTFDILVFKNRSLISCVQRVLTNSSYDHVALLLRSVDDRILMLQATSNMGVIVFTLASLLPVFQRNHFIKMGLRKYCGNRHYSQILELQKFVKKVVGMPYYFDPMYLFSSDIQKNNGYFCSELVVAALQATHIMSTNYKPYTFLPKHLVADNFNQHILDGHYSQILAIQ